MGSSPRIEGKGLGHSRIEATQSMWDIGRKEKDTSKSKSRLKNRKGHMRMNNKGKIHTRTRMPTTNTSDFNKF